MRSFSNATQMSRCALRGNCRTQPVAYFSGLCSLIIFLSLSSIPAYAEWVAVEKDYLLPGLQTLYVDPESICREGNPVTIWQLIDLKWMQGNPRGLIDFCPRRLTSNSTVWESVFGCLLSRSSRGVWELACRVTDTSIRTTGFRLGLRVSVMLSGKLLVARNK